MERKLVTGSFRELAVRGREVFVAAREPKDAHHGHTPGRILAVDDRGDLKEIAQSDDPWISDLHATETSLLWTAQCNGMAAAWRRAVFAIDLGRPDARPRQLVPVVSMREGILSDGCGGAVLSMAGCLAWLPRAAVDIVPVIEPLGAVRGETGMLLAWINACTSDGVSVLWTTSAESCSTSRLCRVPLAGGRIEILRESKRGDLRVLGVNAEGILIEDGTGELALLDAAGRLERVRGAKLKSGSTPFSRCHGGHLWLADQPYEAESCLLVLRAGSRELLQLPYEGLRFAISDYGSYRLTAGGVYVTRWN